jgi:hypothetical protein
MTETSPIMQSEEREAYLELIEELSRQRDYLARAARRRFGLIEAQAQLIDQMLHAHQQLVEALLNADDEQLTAALTAALPEDGWRKLAEDAARHRSRAYVERLMVNGR